MLRSRCAGMNGDLSPDEYRMLSGQKADDFRSITQLNPTLLATTGAIFAAGVARGSTLAIVLSPLPLLLAVFQLIRNTELQLQMITYLAVFGPAGEGRWERDIATVRPRFWAKHYDKRPGLLRPSIWNTWILFAVLTTELLIAFPWMTGLCGGLLAFVAGTVVNALLARALWGTSDRIETVRGEWTELWSQYRTETDRSEQS